MANFQQRLLVGLSGAGLAVIGALLTTAAFVNWGSLSDEHRTFVVTLGVCTAVVGVGMILLARPNVISYRAIRRMVILVMGLTVILIGVALLVLPGPGWVVIFGGLGILATEFAFARRILKKARSSADYAATRIGLSERLRRRLKIHGATDEGAAEG